MAISGNLPFSNAGAGLLMEDPAVGYAKAYTAALNLNKANYQNILNGYNQTMAEQKAQQASVVGGYNQLRSEVLNRLSGANTSAIQSINDRYSADQGRASQQLVNRGLGNTTVQQSVNRGLAFDRAKAEVDARDRYAQNVARYDTDIGLAREGYRGNATRDNTSLATRQLDWMNSIQSPYPDAGPYMKIAEMRAKAAPPSYPNFGMPGGGGGGGMGGGGMPPGRPPRLPVDPDAANMRYWNSWATGRWNPFTTDEPPMAGGLGPFAVETAEPPFFNAQNTWGGLGTAEPPLYQPVYGDYPTSPYTYA